LNEESFYEPAIRRGDTQYGDGYTEKLFERMNKLDPDFSMMFQKMIHGGLYDRDVIPHKIREFCAISALLVTGRFDQMKGHLTAAHNYGAEDKEILEVIFQMFTYTGAPAVLEALKIYEQWVEDGHSMSGFGSSED
tara:strand:+ start:1957 stop:2364 length:408 start_codon:yes stop_codon:yes gene_type:complete